MSTPEKVGKNVIAKVVKRRSKIANQISNKCNETFTRFHHAIYILFIKVSCAFSNR